MRDELKQESVLVRHYAVSHSGDHRWVVSADGEEVMVCARKCDAVNAAKMATELLNQVVTPTGSEPQLFLVAHPVAGG